MSAPRLSHATRIPFSAASFQDPPDAPPDPDHPAVRFRNGDPSLLVDWPCVWDRGRGRDQPAWYGRFETSIGSDVYMPFQPRAPIDGVTPDQSAMLWRLVCASSVSVSTTYRTGPRRLTRADARRAITTHRRRARARGARAGAWHIDLDDDRADTAIENARTARRSMIINLAARSALRRDARPEQYDLF